MSEGFANTAELISYLDNAIDTVSFAEERREQRIVPINRRIEKLGKKWSWVIKFFLYWMLGDAVASVIMSVVCAIVDDSQTIDVIQEIVYIGAFIFLILVHLGIKAAKERRINELIEKIAEEERWINNFYIKNWESVGKIPNKYRTTLAIRIMQGYLEDGRAHNLQTAMNLCDAQLHRLRMEDMQSEIVAENLDQSKSLRGIRRSSATSAAASVANVFIKLCK